MYASALHMLGQVSEGTAGDEKNVGGIHLNRLLEHALFARADIHYRTLHHAQQRLKANTRVNTQRSWAVSNLLNGDAADVLAIGRAKRVA